MKINNVSSVSCKGKLPAQDKIRELIVPLKNNMSADLKVSADSLECTVTKTTKDGLKGVAYYNRANDSSSKTLWRTFEKLQKNVKEGYDFFGEFCRAIFSKEIK